MHPQSSQLPHKRASLWCQLSVELYRVWQDQGYHALGSQADLVFLALLPHCQELLSMTRFEKIPGTTFKASLAQFSTEQEEITFLSLLSTRAITEEVDHRDRWMVGLYIVQYWVKMLPNCWRTFLLGLRDGAKAERACIFTNIQHTSVHCRLLVRGTEMHSLDLGTCTCSFQRSPHV